MTLKAPKLEEVVVQIADLLDADPLNKLVVFSKHPAMLRILQSRTNRYTHSTMLIGGMKPKDRQAAMEQFQNDKRTGVFLSSDAGGYGIDLPAANYLINFDLPFSAGKVMQRNARIDRLSSEHDSVTVLNALMRGSIEERVYDMLSEKKAIASAWLDGKGIVGKHGTLELTLSTLTEFLENTVLPVAA